MSSEKAQSVCWRCGSVKDLTWNYCPNCNARLIDTRNPSPPNPARDVSFLYDLYSFGWYNHHVGAVALYDSAASIDHFYILNLPESKAPEHYSLIVEQPLSQQMLRAKIFAELISLFEAFGVLCSAIAKRKKQSFIWTYLNAEPQEVTQLYDNVINSPSMTLDSLLKLPRLSDIRKALEKGGNTPIPGIPEALPLLNIDQLAHDYEHLFGDIVRIAKMYRDHGGGNVKIYNKIKHIFPIVMGTHWLDRPLDVSHAGIAIDDQGTIAPLPMDEESVDKEIDATYKVTCLGAELMAICIGLARLNLL